METDEDNQNEDNAVLEFRADALLSQRLRRCLGAEAWRGCCPLLGTCSLKPASPRFCNGQLMCRVYSIEYRQASRVRHVETVWGNAGGAAVASPAAPAMIRC